MTQHLFAVPGELRDLAQSYRETAERLTAAPDGHAALIEMLHSLGPVFAGVTDAGRDLLEQRQACYREQAATHADVAEGLWQSAAAWERHDADSAMRLRATVQEQL